MSQLPKTGPLSSISTGKSEPPPSGLTVVAIDQESDDWLCTLRRESKSPAAADKPRKTR